MSIASEITRLQNAKSALATSIANKGVTVPSSTTLDGYSALVDQIQTGGSSDWVKKDGKTYIHLEIPNSSLCAQTLYFNANDLSASIDWGDGSTSSCMAGFNAYNHTYSAAGSYIIAITPGSSNMLFGNSSASTNSIYGVRANRYSFGACVRYIEIGSKCVTTGAYAFQYCYGLREVYIPNTVTTISAQTFRDCRGLTKIRMESNHPGFALNGTYTWSNNYGLQDASFMEHCTTAAPGTYQFSNCASLSKVVIPSVVTSLGNNTFNNCASLLEMRCYPTTPPTVSNANVFTSLNPNCVIYVPSSALSAYQSATNWSTYASQMVSM